jgi:hypothetical protein
MIKIKKDYFMKGYYSIHKISGGSEMLIDYTKSKKDALAIKKLAMRGHVKGLF